MIAMGASMAIRPREAFGWLGKVVGAVALAAVTAILTYLVTAQLNVETAVQQQQSAAITQFEQSGSQMDANLSLFVDALLDQKGVADARNAARASIVLHSSQAGALKPLAGSGNVDQYVNALGDLREFTDAVDGKQTARKMAQQHVNVMAYREKLVRLSRERVYK